MSLKSSNMSTDAIKNCKQMITNEQNSHSLSLHTKWMWHSVRYLSVTWFFYFKNWCGSTDSYTSEAQELLRSDGFPDTIKIGQETSTGHLIGDTHALHIAPCPLPNKWSQKDMSKTIPQCIILKFPGTENNMILNEIFRDSGTKLHCGFVVNMPCCLVTKF